MYITPIQGIIITVNVVVLCPLVLGMLSLFFWQQGLALQNTTTIEFHIKRYGRKKAKREGKKYIWPYDFGPAKNLILFFGNRSSRWFCPVLPDNLSDGINYPIAQGKFDFSLVVFISFPFLNHYFNYFRT